MDERIVGSVCMVQGVNDEKNDRSGVWYDSD